MKEKNCCSWSQKKSHDAKQESEALDQERCPKKDALPGGGTLSTGNERISYSHPTGVNVIEGETLGVPGWLGMTIRRGGLMAACFFSDG